MQDLAHDVFVVLCHRLVQREGDIEVFKIDCIGRLMCWLRRATRNIWLHYINNPRQRDGGKPSDLDLAEIVDREPEPSEEAELVELSARLILQVEGLPENLRQAIRLRAMDELAYSQIAEQLGVPAGTARYRVSEARRLLLERIRATDPGLLAWIYQNFGDSGPA